MGGKRKLFEGQHALCPANGELRSGARPRNGAEAALCWHKTPQLHGVCHPAPCWPWEHAKESIEQCYSRDIFRQAGLPQSLSKCSHGQGCPHAQTQVALPHSWCHRGTESQLEITVPHSCHGLGEMLLQMGN